MGIRTGSGADAWRGYWLDLGRFILGLGLLLLSGGEVLLVSWFCLDCRQVGQLSKHGKCATCGSDAVTESEGRKTFERRHNFQSSSDRIDIERIDLWRDCRTHNLRGYPLHREILVAEKVEVQILQGEKEYGESERSSDNAAEQLRERSR